MMTRRVLVGSTGDPVGNPGMPVRKLTLVLFEADARSGDADTVEMESGNAADGRSDGSGEAGSS
jgi:hypothetical protein